MTTDDPTVFAPETGLPGKLRGHPEHPQWRADPLAYARRFFYLRRPLTRLERLRAALARVIERWAALLRPDDVVALPGVLVAGAIEAIIASERKPRRPTLKREEGNALLEAVDAAPVGVSDPELDLALAQAEIGIPPSAAVMARVVRFLVDNPDVVRIHVGSRFGFWPGTERQNEERPYDVRAQ